jgi:glutathione peroxidase
MKNKVLLLTFLFIMAVAACKNSNNMEIYKFSVKDRKGNDVSLADYKGKVLLIVNTATRCGFTPQYTELEALYEKNSAKGLEILDFPCNQFGQQAPGTEEEIHEFCQLNYATKFPQFKKIEVNGEGQSPLFAYLKSQKGFKGFDPNHKIGKILIDMLSKADPDYDKTPDIKWNFTKFLIDRNGNVVERFEPTEDIKVIEKAVEELL